MNTRRSNASSRNRLAGRWLSLAFVALLALPPIAVAAWHTVTARSSGAHAVVGPFAPTSIEVNTTGDGDNLDANAGCDVDAGTPGEQCTLRAAIQRANALAGDDTITFSIPTSQPNCVLALDRCTINLNKVLPDLSTNIEINGPGPTKLHVNVVLNGTFRIFNVTSASSPETMMCVPCAYSSSWVVKG